jgi:hypothetical protein
LDCRLDGQGFDSPRGVTFFSSPLRPDRLWGPSSPLANGYFVRCPRKWLEADNLTPSSAEDKISGTIPQFHHMSSWRSA